MDQQSTATWNPARADALRAALDEIILIVGSDLCLHTGQEDWSAYTGLSVEQCVGTQWQQALLQTDCHTLKACLTDPDRPGQRLVISLRIRDAAGIFHLHEWRIAPTIPGENAVIEWICVIRQVPREIPFLQHLFAHMEQGAIIQDAQGTIIAANPAAQRILGVTLDQLSGRTSHDARWRAIREDGSPFPGDQHPAMRALASQTVIRDIMGVWHPVEASYHWILISSTPLSPNNALMTGVISTFDDITTLKAAQDTIRTHAAELEAIFDALTDGIVVYNALGQITHINAALQRMAGVNHYYDFFLSVEERLSVSPLYTLRGDLVPPEQWPVQRVLRGEILANSTLERLWMRTADAGDILLSISGSPVLSASGEITGAILIIRDETERYLLEGHVAYTIETLLRIEEQLAIQPPKMGGGDPLPIDDALLAQIMETTRRVLKLDRTSLLLFDYEHDSMLMRAVAVKPPELEQDWRESIARTRLSEWFDAPLMRRLTAGEVIIQPPRPTVNIPNNPRIIMLNPIIIDNNLLGCMTGSYLSAIPYNIEVITPLARSVSRLMGLIFERFHTQQERERLRWMQEEFINIASHELRAPLTPLLLASQMVQRAARKPGQEARIIHLAEEIALHAKRMNRMVDDMLNMTRIEAGRFTLVPAPCDLAATIRDAIQTQHDLTHRDLLLVGADAPIEAVVDAERIWQVLTNLVSNAIKYSPSPSPVEVLVEQMAKDQAPWLRVSVHDAGPGIPASALPHLFQRFYRVIATQESSQDGLGLGLYIAHSIIHSHGGTIWVETTEGVGSTFIAEFPLFAGELRENTEAAEDSGRGADSASITDRQLPGDSAEHP